MTGVLKSKPSHSNRGRESGVRSQLLTTSTFHVFRAFRGYKNQKTKIKNPQSSIPLSLLLFLALHTFSHASPLDERIEAFRAAATQKEADVAELLKTGLREQRSAEAFAATRSWLTANPSESQALLFPAAKAADHAGEWQDALSFYRKFLKLPNPDATMVGDAVNSAYRLMLLHLGDPESAYLFMREDGDRLRSFGRARQYDAWFLEQAWIRKDWTSVANRLAAISNSDDPLEPFAGSMQSLFGELESYQYSGKPLFDALDKLAAAKRSTPAIKARVAWVKAIVPLSAAMAEKVGAKQEIPGGIMDIALRAAEDLVNALPYEGSLAVAKGWMHFNAGDSGVFASFVNPRREEKAAPILKALRSLPAGQVRELLSLKVAFARDRKVADYLFSLQELRTLVATMPAVFNTLSAPDVPLLDKSLTPDEAKALAPNLARNPHVHAAMVRAWASPERRFSVVFDNMMKSDMWRSTDIKGVTEFLWKSALFENDGKADDPVKKFAALDARYQQLKKQVDAKAGSQDRIAAFNTLLNDLLNATPTITGALSLWDDLFTNAPDPDKVAMIKSLSANLQGDREVLLHRALVKSTFGKSGRMPWQAVIQENHARHHQVPTREAAAELIQHLGGMVKAQSASGTLSETIFGMWLHSVDANQDEAKQLMASVAASPAYAKIDPAYQLVASGAGYFGYIAMTPEMAAGNPRLVSRELIELLADAPPAQVEAALRTVVDRAAKAPIPVTVIGLAPVAALPEWSPPTRELVLSLFKDNAPLDSYLAGHGYEMLVVRIADEARASKQWGPLEPYAAGLWSAAAIRDNPQSPGANALSLLAEDALKAGAPSVAATFSRTALRGPAGRILFQQKDWGIPAIAARVRVIPGKVATVIGAVEIPVDETSPAYPIYKSNAEFVLGNEDSAWQLYLGHTDQLAPVIRTLPVNYPLWLLEKSIEADRGDEAENLIKELTIWSRQAEGTFSPEQDAQLKIAYADLAFRKGALPTARAWYRKVAEAAEYQGSEVHLTAALGSVTVDRVSKNFGAAMTELDNLMKLPNQEFRKKIRYARAEVLMDQESFAEALEEIDQVLRQEPKHPDALILRGKIHYEMRKLIEASEIELGPSQDKTIIVPGETVKINLRDPTLNVSGVGADIEVEVWAKSGDRERVLLYQLGDSKEKFRADVPTALGPPTPNDKVLQVLGDDEIRFGYSQRFRAKMKDLPADPDTVIGVASDAYLSFSAGAFPPREGERRLNIEELGLSTSQAALGTRTVRPGNPIYLRVNDADRSLTPGIDEITVSLQTTSGDEIRQLTLKETAPFSGEFQAIVPTASAQAIAFASESAPGRDPNMAISAREYPGWQGNVGDATKPRTFGIDLNDNVAIDKMSLDSGTEGSVLKNFVLQTSLDGKTWITRARFPETVPVWDGSPQFSAFPTSGQNSTTVAKPEGREIPAAWAELMDYGSNRASLNYDSANVKSLSAEPMPLFSKIHPNLTVVARYRALFHQPAAAIRRFQLTGFPNDGNTIFLLNGIPASEDSDNPLLIERELQPGLHEIQIWRNDSRGNIIQQKPALLCDDNGKPDLIPCPDAMFDPSTFPDELKKTLPQPAQLTANGNTMDIAFGDQTRARLVRLVINGFDGVAPTVKKVSLTDREGKALLPVARDFMELRSNDQLEVLPGDTITARYQDPKSATAKRDRHEQRLNVAFNDAKLSASFLTYVETEEGRELVLEPIRRFRYDDAVAIVVEDPDMDSSAEKDIIDVKVTSSFGGNAIIKAVETEEHSGLFLARIFPVNAEPSRASEIKVTEGGTLTAVYRDTENLSPGIPADREVIIQHARYVEPSLAPYTTTTKPLTIAPVENSNKNPSRATAAEVVTPRIALNFEHSTADNKALTAVIGSSVRFDVVVQHLALAGSSTLNAYVQTEAGRKAKQSALKQPYDVAAPGTLKLTGALTKAGVVVPDGYQSGSAPTAPGNEPQLEEGRFAFSIPLILGETPDRSFATKSAESLPDSSIPDGLAVKAGDTVHVGFPYKDAADAVKWITASFVVESHPFLDVMDGGYTEPLAKAFVGEKIHLRLIDRGLDRGPERDTVNVTLKATSGASTSFELQETEGHSGIFKSAFAISYAPDELPAKLPPVALNGFPVRYGDKVEISYAANGENQSHSVTVNMGADGFIEPFSKRFSGDEMAVRTSFTLAECYFELAKKHRELEQESLARREIAQARKLLAEAIATHRDDDLRAHAEYLLGNLAQEYADLSKNEEAKLPMYQDALARFSKIPSDYPDTEFAPKAQFKTALVYEKMGETENAVEEYVKLAYKYPNHELIPSVMSRLGGYFQQTGLALKQQADPLREKEDDATKAEVLRLDQLSYPEFLNAAMVFAKLQQRFPDDPLAGLAGLRAGQNYMRAHQYAKAVKVFANVYDNENYDDREIRSQALYWSGISNERMAGLMSEDNWRGRGEAMDTAYETYRRVTFDFPDSLWAKYARGRLADPVFAKKIELENQERERMIEALKESRKSRR